MRRSDFRLEEARNEDLARAAIRLGRVRTLFFFYFGVFVLAAVIMITIGSVEIHRVHKDWEHDTAILVLGGFLLIMAPFGFINDSYYNRQDLDE